VTADPTAVGPPRRGLLRSVAAALYRHPRAQLGLLLAAPLGWLVVAYLGSLALFLITSFWKHDSLTGNLITTPTLDNYIAVATTEVYRTIALRTVIMATLVTLTTVLVAFPIAFYMARLASARTRGILIVSILLPLWSGYLVKVYAWRLILSQGGVLNWALAPIGLSGPGYSDVAVWLVESYLWLPYMIIPIFAGSIFTFSLTLGDYITPTLVSNTRFIGNVVYDFVGVAGNQPLAAAYAMVPVTIMLVYLLIARRLGAFEAL
jgi:putative spermidine/putrescine transport system permease protein